jgi:hypothetical protein
VTDKSETEIIERRLMEATKKLHQLAPLVGAARQVIEFASDMRKNTLAKFQRRYIERGEGASNSEALARSDPLYLESIKSDEDRVAEAYRVRMEWDATMCSFEAGRSLLAMTRESLRTLEG